MANKSYMDNKITWQAHSVMKVEQECLSSGFFPNGKRLSVKDRQDSAAQIEICKQLLDEYGIIYQEKPKAQLQLF